jgi:hypothetical protein
MDVRNVKISGYPLVFYNDIPLVSGCSKCKDMGHSLVFYNDISLVSGC